MKYKELKPFPNDFMWSVSTSAFQVEGAANMYGKGLSTVDTRQVKPGLATTEVASDHYHHLEEDIALLAELGIKTYRFSISWTRIYPAGTGELNPEGIRFYDRLINELKRHHIEPLVSIYHFDYPQALVDAYGGWLHRSSIEDYAAYACTLFEHFGDRVKYWITINEQLMVMYAQDFNGLRHLDNKSTEYEQAVFQMSYHMSLAEKRAMQSFRKLVPGGKIGMASAFQNVYPASIKHEDIIAAMDAEEFMSFTLLDVAVRGEYPPSVARYLQDKGIYPQGLPEDAELLRSEKPDFIGLNYYASIYAQQPQTDYDPALPPFFQSDNYDIVTKSADGNSEWMVFGTDPAGLRISLRKLYNRYKLPVMITENGFAASEEPDEEGAIHDTYRIDYIGRHLAECQLAITEGIPLMGYSPWTFIDALSGRQGFSKRYGLVFVNRNDNDTKDLRRVRKDSFYWYKEVIRTGSLPETNKEA